MVVIVMDHVLTVFLKKEDEDLMENKAKRVNLDRLESQEWKVYLVLKVIPAYQDKRDRMARKEIAVVEVQTATTVAMDWTEFQVSKVDRVCPVWMDVMVPLESSVLLVHLGSMEKMANLVELALQETKENPPIWTTVHSKRV